MFNKGLLLACALALLSACDSSSKDTTAAVEKPAATAPAEAKAAKREDPALLAKRYPEARFQMAHFGGDWEFGIRAVKDCPNVWADFAGTINEYGANELAVAELGEDRVIFGTDLPADFHGNLGRVLQGNWPRPTLDKILAGNFETMLGRRL